MTDRASFEEWERAWQAVNDSHAALRPSLVTDGAVTILGGTRDGVIAAGAVLKRGHGVVGLSNNFGDLGGGGERDA